MKVKDLINLLQKQNPEKEVLIQQGEEHDYMVAYSVKERAVADTNNEGEIIESVVIEYS